MILSQSWIGYVDRSYEQIKRSLLQRLAITNPEITDYSESNILIVILSMFAGVGEMLNLYMDNMARESYIGTARKYSSMVKLAQVIDYNVKAKSASSISEAFILNTVYGSSITIPANTQFSNGLGVVFRLPRDLVIPAGTLKMYADIVQSVQSDTNALGTSNGTALQTFQLPDSYVHKSLRIYVNGDPWQEYNSLGLMNSTTTGFVVNVREDSHVYVTFGDGVNGMIPVTGGTIVENHDDSLGASGNLPPNTITTIETNLTLPDGISLSVNNEDYSSGGEDFETLEDIRNRAPRMIRTLETAKTYQDYLDLPILVPGVKDAGLRFCCGKYIDLFIIPKGRGIATQELLDDVRDYMEPRKMITTNIHYYAAGITKIWIKGKVYGKPLVKSIDIQLQVADALDSKYGYDVGEINRRIVISEIIATIENLLLVDHFDLEEVHILPFARALDATTSTLNVNFLTLPTATAETDYKIVWNTDHFEVYVNDIFAENKNAGEVYSDDVLSFQLNAGGYTNGDNWEFIAFPSYPEIFPNTILLIDDLSQSVVDVAPFIDSVTPRTIYGDIQIIETSIDPAKMPVC